MFFTIILQLTLAGFATLILRSGMVLKISDDEAHVNFDNRETKIGDSVLLYFNDCKVSLGTYRSTKSVLRACK